ncbi:MAG: hypothetical protein WCJ39_08590, partial [bacterium]
LSSCIEGWQSSGLNFIVYTVTLVSVLTKTRFVERSGYFGEMPQAFRMMRRRHFGLNAAGISAQMPHN